MKTPGKKIGNTLKTAWAGQPVRNRLFLVMLLAMIPGLYREARLYPTPPAKNLELAQTGQITGQGENSPTGEKAGSGDAPSKANPEKETGPEESGRTISVMRLFHAGGWAMWPLLLLSVILATVVLERFIFFLFTRVTSKAYLDDLSDHLGNHGLAGFHKMDSGLAVTKIIRESLTVSSSSAPVFARVAEKEAGNLLVRSERGLALLAAISTIAPLIGFLGTVSGMIGAFDAIANADTVNAKVVAGGIKEALITTATGLIVGIPAMGFFQFFSGRVNHYASQIEGAANAVYKELLRGEVTGENKSNGGAPAPETEKVGAAV